METTKKWWMSKTIQASVVTFLIGTYELARIHLFNYSIPEIPGWILTVLGVLGFYGRVTAKDRIGK